MRVYIVVMEIFAKKVITNKSIEVFNHGRKSHLNSGILPAFVGLNFLLTQIIF